MVLVESASSVHWILRVNWLALTANPKYKPRPIAY